MSIKTAITKLHYTREPKGVLFEILKFCSFFYGLGAHFKNFVYDKKILRPKKVDAFVISVGNMTTGGVGKTPVVSESHQRRHLPAVWLNHRPQSQHDFHEHLGIHGHYADH